MSFTITDNPNNFNSWVESTKHIYAILHKLHDGAGGGSQVYPLSNVKYDAGTIIDPNSNGVELKLWFVRLEVTAKADNPQPSDNRVSFPTIPAKLYNVNMYHKTFANESNTDWPPLSNIQYPGYSQGPGAFRANVNSDWQIDISAKAYELQVSPSLDNDGYIFIAECYYIDGTTVNPSDVYIPDCELIPTEGNPDPCGEGGGGDKILK